MRSESWRSFAGDDWNGMSMASGLESKGRCQALTCSTSHMVACGKLHVRRMPLCRPI